MFWAAWFTVVVLTNVFDVLKAARVVPAGWIAYSLGPVHLRLFGPQLLSLLALRVLPR